MILNKLQEALLELGAQREALDEVESQLRSMISQLSVMAETTYQLSNMNSSETGIIASAGSIVGRERDRLDDIRDILRETGRPLHITAIASRLSDNLGKRILRTEIEPGLNRHVTKAKTRRIEKFGPSIFGLPEWKHPSLAKTA